MTDAEKAIREALADPALFDEGASVDDTFRAADDFGAACSPANVRELLDEMERLRAENRALLNALETMLIGACAVGVPHAGERQVLQECVDAARAVIDAARKEQA